MSAALGKAVEALMAGRLDDARRACRKALQARADLAEAHMLLAEIHRLAGEHAREAEALGRVLKLRPGWSDAHVHLALADLYSDARRPAHAEEAYRRALALHPGLSDARFNLAALLRDQGRVAECADELRALLEHDPQARDAREQLIRLLQDGRRWEEVEALSRAGMALHPGDSFFAEKLGVALWWLGEHEAAIEAYRDAARLAGPATAAHADARFLEANALLSLGRLAGGWPAYAFRPSRIAIRARHPEIIPAPFPIEGEGKRIRIYAEQGLGDEIFFMRFAPALRAKGHRLDLVCEPKLARFLASQPALFEEINAAHPAPAEVCIASGDLPIATGAQTAPPLPLSVDARKQDEMHERLRSFGPAPYIGVTWRAGQLPQEQQPGKRAWQKDVPAAMLGEALRDTNASVIVVTRRPLSGETMELEHALGRAVLDLSAVNDELSDALALLSLLDEYVGVSNTNMHLLAGLEKKAGRALVLTPPEWRWGLHGSESVWFPGFSLYRQRVGRDWAGAISALRNDLAQRYAAMQRK